MPYERYTPEEVASLGEALYRREIRDTLSDDDEGKFVIIDIETGQYDVDDDDLSATNRMLARRPDAVLYGIRVGYPAAYRLGMGAAGQPE